MTDILKYELARAMKQMVKELDHIESVDPARVDGIEVLSEQTLEIHLRVRFDGFSRYFTFKLSEHY